ncbi:MULTISPECIES: hypothetical protein [Akkermansia]|uniref:hypothetical protein n=1 Tax=unclassified Akkermansia TaxID=2608915 RepID=UPI00102085F2|nr:MULTISPECIES: hypothetical protein [Akkermansia]KAA3166985.1 hypothetical protein F1996_11750 [Akkermansia sp. BIOML-A58]KAA3177299.1 hypothetical protein F1989_08290 [Akkermansia sp. BIOML-A53]KAA3192646.1 hypothetical protein F2A08_05855 [Akkermansia sp. BIOML-A50]KAA3195906.1 hypothetical protein F2A21_03420 [Akkermansia sp. BIOML-A54]KAA3223027.1 hypothetical protein F1964_01850 [Akkermansia sp. BIOML-A38]KAA3226578.1 hypothetical protein F1985_01845 [Akkermansia sp. BIOML-A41]KAA3228
MQLLQFLSFKGTHALHAARFCRTHAMMPLMLNSFQTSSLTGNTTSPYLAPCLSHALRRMVSMAILNRPFSNPYSKEASCSGVIFIFGLLFYFFDFKIFAGICISISII